MGKPGRVWHSRIIQRIRTTFEAKIAKDRGKPVARRVGYDNDEDALRLEFGSDMELDELEMAGGRADSGSHRQREPQREHGANP